MVREQAAAPSAEAALGAEAEQQSVWERFLAAVQKEKISLFFALKSGHFLGLTPTTLQIGVDKDPYFKELTRTENRTLLEETARRCFGRDLKVEVTKGSTLPAAAASPVAMAAQSHKPQEQQTEGDPLVKTVLDVLGGEVQATRSYRPASEPHNNR